VVQGAEDGARMGKDLADLSSRPGPARTSQRTPNLRGTRPYGHSSEPIGQLGREPASPFPGPPTP
jgi:hypothetical protein